MECEVVGSNPHLPLTLTLIYIRVCGTFSNSQTPSIRVRSPDRRSKYVPTLTLTRALTPTVTLTLTLTLSLTLTLTLTLALALMQSSLTLTLTHLLSSITPIYLTLSDHLEHQFEPNPNANPNPNPNPNENANPRYEPYLQAYSYL